MHTNQAFLNIQTKTGRRITKQLGNSLNKQFEVNEVIFSVFLFMSDVNCWHIRRLSFLETRNFTKNRKNNFIVPLTTIDNCSTYMHVNAN